MVLLIKIVISAGVRWVNYNVPLMTVSLMENGLNGPNGPNVRRKTVELGINGEPECVLVP